MLNKQMNWYSASRWLDWAIYRESWTSIFYMCWTQNTQTTPAGDWGREIAGESVPVRKPDQLADSRAVGPAEACDALTQGEQVSADSPSTGRAQEPKFSSWGNSLNKEIDVMWSPHRLSEGSSKLTGYFFFFFGGLEHSKEGNWGRQAKQVQ